MDFNKLLQSIANGGLTLNATGSHPIAPTPYANTPTGVTSYARTLYPQGNVLAAETGPGGVGRTATTAPAPSAPTGSSTQPDFGAQLARQAYEAAVRQAGDFRNRGQQTFDTIMKSIQDFRNRANTNYTNADQQITNSAADIAGTNATNAQQAAGTLNAQGRNLGLSSKYNLGQELFSKLAGIQGNTLARKGEQQAANRADLSGNLATADTKTSDANTYLQGVNDSANAVEAGGVNNYGGALNNILNYQRSISALNPASLTQVTPDFSGLTNTLNTITAGAPSGGITADQGANPYSPTNILDILKRTQGLVQ